MRQANDNMSRSELRILAAIDANGVHIESVAAVGDQPAYSYTVGMTYSFAAPEILVFGLEAEVAADLLNAVADEAADGKTFAAAQELRGLVDNYPVRFLAVPQAQLAALLPVAGWANEGDKFACLQLVWPDKQGRWPWQAGVREGFAALQPVLGQTQGDLGQAK